MVDAVATELRVSFGRPAVRAAATSEESLPGGESADFAPFQRSGAELGLSTATVEHILTHFGTEAAAIFNLGRDNRDLLEPLHPGHPAIRAEVIHIVRRELAQKLEDTLVRRLHIYYETADRGAAAVEDVAHLMGEELRWTPDELEKRVNEYRDHIERSSTVPPMGED